MKKDLSHWLIERLAVIHGRYINRDDLTYLSLMEMLYLYCEIAKDLGVQIPPKYIEDDVFSSFSRLVVCIEGLMSKQI